jgi:hypothetical protein
MRQNATNMTKGTRQFFSCLAKVGKSKFFVVFVLALLLRAIPEFLSGAYPVGFDMLAGYFPSVAALPSNDPMKLFGWAYSPLAIYLIGFFQIGTGGDIFLLLKIVGPVFYGFFVASFYFMLSRGLGWSSRKSLVVSLLFLLQPAVMRAGWDQLREELGLIILFVLLGSTKLDFVEGAKSKPFSVLASSILIVFSHQLAAILFFVIAIFQLTGTLIKRQKRLWLPLVLIIPSALLFIWQLYGQFANPSYSNHFMPLTLPSGTGNFVFTNYFLSDPRFLGGDYWRVLGYVSCLSLYVIVPLVPFALKGFFRDKVVTPMLIWLSVMSFSIVVYPWYAFSNYWWWILLLPIPLTIYAGHCLDRLNVFSDAKRWKKTLLGLGVVGVVAFGYAASVIPVGYPYAYYYIPSGLVNSSVPFEDIPDIDQAMEWTNQHISPETNVIVSENIQGLAYVKLRDDINIRVVPALMKLEEVGGLIDWKNEEYWVIYYITEIGSVDEYPFVLRISFGDIGIFNI